MKNTERVSGSAPLSQAIQLKRKETNSSGSPSVIKRKFRRGDPHPINMGLFFWGLTYKYKSNGQRSVNESWVNYGKLARRRRMMMACILVWQKNNPEKVKSCNRATKLKYAARDKINIKRWKIINVDRWRKTKREWHKKKMRECPIYRLKISVRQRICQFLSTRNLKKIIATRKIVGCSPAFLKDYIESKFKPGMSWENRSDFHIDHRIPLKSARTKKEIFKLCHYKNLQPLWGPENLAKGSKIPT